MKTKHTRFIQLLKAGLASLLGLAFLLGSASAAVTGAQSAISLSGGYSWDYTMDLYNGTTGDLITSEDYKWADMNATDWSEGVGDYTFTHTFAGDVSAWYTNENNADQILQSYWFYFPEDYEDDTNNITIFVHWGVVGTGFLSYVWFMNFTCYMAYDWTNLTHPDCTSNLVQNNPVDFADEGFSIETTIINTAFVATGNWSGAMTIASITGTSGTFDFWPEYTTEEGTGRNLLADRAVNQPEFQAFVDLFDEVFGVGGDDDDPDDDGGDGGSTSGSPSSSTVDENSTTVPNNSFPAWWDANKTIAIPILLIIIVVVLVGQSMSQRPRPKGPAKWAPSPTPRPKKKPVHKKKSSSKTRPLTKRRR
jgi:hypothetical protein